MKELLNKLFNKKIITPIISGIGVIMTFEYVIFPGLTAPNTLINIVSVLILLLLFAFIYYFFKVDLLFKKEITEAGETELDFVPKDDIVKPNKKRNPKQNFSDTNDKFVKTRNKKK